MLGAPRGFCRFLQTAIRDRPGPLNPITRLVETTQDGAYRRSSDRSSYLDHDPLAVAGVELGGVRTLLVVPMLKDDELIGAIRHLPP